LEETTNCAVLTYPDSNTAQCIQRQLPNASVCTVNA